MLKEAKPFRAATVLTAMLLFCWGFSEVFGIPHAMTFEKVRLSIASMYACAMWSYWKP